jgi:hypothetical protein
MVDGVVRHRLRLEALAHDTQPGARRRGAASEAE